MTVSYSVCVSSAGIDYSRVTSVSYTYSDFYIKPAVFWSSWLGLRWPSCWLCLPRCKATRQRSRCHRFGALLRWGNRFLSGIRVLSYDYSRVTRVRVLLMFLTTSLRYLRILASLGVPWCDTPYFLAYPHVFLKCGPFIGFLGSFGISQSYSYVGVDRHDDYSADSSASLAQCGFVGVFFFRISRFSDHLKNFCFYSWASLLVLPSLLRLPILLSL